MDDPVAVEIAQRLQHLGQQAATIEQRSLRPRDEDRPPSLQKFHGVVGLAILVEAVVEH
jgi:hypothetical protein